MPEGMMTGGPRRNFYELVREAISDVMEFGFDSQARIEQWLERIRRAAVETLTPEATMIAAMREGLQQIYGRMIDRGEILRLNPGVDRFTLQKVKPQLRGELDRRILAAANLIKLNRAQAIEQTLRRFAGWSTSIPAGGSRATGRQKAAANVRKALTQLPFIERRVLIDQGHKFAASLSEILANDAGAIAGRWRSNWRQANYNYREDHKERDQHVFLVRDSWAHQQGLVKPGDDGYVDKITKPGEEVYCRCWYVWIYTLSQMPEDMLTAKGRLVLRNAKLRAAQLRAGDNRSAA